jgi:alpha-L-fucosidase 2
VCGRTGDKELAGKLLIRMNETYIKSNYLMTLEPDRKSVFQIDLNMGLLAGLAELLIRSDGENIYLLSALPERFSKGEVKGLKLKGGMTAVGLIWNLDHINIELLSENDKSIKIFADDIQTKISLHKNKIQTVNLKRR